tara:strand:- start:1337 stop:1657 length:321 start_codon:yes stop_codon:yes gene_type:complete
MSIVVEVTKDDIRKGVRKSGCSCPIALALTRAILADLEKDGREVDEENVLVEVDYDDIRFWLVYESDDEINLFPEDEEDWYGIKNFIENFDLGNDVEPFNVELKYN